MKKSISILVMVFTISLTFGQKNVRQTASNYLKEGKLDKALEAINQCITDPSTAQDFKTWYLRANIFLALANSKDEAYKKLDPDPIAGAIESFKKTVEYDTKKEQYEDVFAKVDGLRVFYFNEAVQKYNQGDFPAAARNFVHSADVISIVNVMDTTSLFNAALSAVKGNDFTYAKSIYLRLLKEKVTLATIYTSLSDIYRAEKKMDSALYYVKAGQTLYPDNLSLFLTETNVYLSSNDIDKALQNLKVGIEKDPNNPSIYMVMGTIYDRIVQDPESDSITKDKSFNSAVEAYEKALAINPDYFDAAYNLGALFVNRAAMILDVANKLPLDEAEKFDKMSGEADKYLEKAIPYLENASTLEPNDLNTLYSLKQIYARKKMNDKMKEVNLKINSIQGKQ
jgi:tetratricopeptide (TPR) repeat protein